MTAYAIFSVFHKGKTPTLKDRAVEGKCRFEDKGDDFFGCGDPYKSRVYKNPTWATVLKLSDDMIKATGDQHHVYLEGIQKVRTDGDVAVYRFEMGS